MQISQYVAMLVIAIEDDGVHSSEDLFVALPQSIYVVVHGFSRLVPALDASLSPV